MAGSPCIIFLNILLSYCLSQRMNAGESFENRNSVYAVLYLYYLQLECLVHSCLSRHYGMSEYNVILLTHFDNML